LLLLSLHHCLVHHGWVLVHSLHLRHSLLVSHHHLSLSHLVLLHLYGHHSLPLLEHCRLGVHLHRLRWHYLAGTDHTRSLLHVPWVARHLHHHHLPPLHIHLVHHHLLPNALLLHERGLLLLCLCSKGPLLLCLVLHHSDVRLLVVLSHGVAGALAGHEVLLFSQCLNLLFHVITEFVEIGDLDFQESDLALLGGEWVGDIVAVGELRCLLLVGGFVVGILFFVGQEALQDEGLDWEANAKDRENQCCNREAKHSWVNDSLAFSYLLEVLGLERISETT
jgi:hypothetical protein